MFSLFAEERCWLRNVWRCFFPFHWGLGAVSEWPTTYFLEAPLRMLCHRDRCFGKGGTWKVFFALLFSTIPVSLPVAGGKGTGLLVEPWQ